VDFHPSVLVKEVIECLRPRPGGVYLDATCGAAGHSLALLQAGRGARVVGIERDPSLVERARLRVRNERIPPEQFVLVPGAYIHLRTILTELAIDRVDGCLFDLGACAFHFAESGRGFSFRAAQEPLDMRYDPGQGPTAADLLARLSPSELERLFREAGGERWARRIARRIAEQRATSPIRTAGQLASLVEQAIPRKAWPPDIHPATRVFMSLRARVNEEFEQIARGIPEAIDVLRPGGRIAVISFHSGEDGLVKRIFREAAGLGPGHPVTGQRPKARLKILTRKPITASPEEIARNPGARSAKLRAAEKLGD